MLSSLLIEKAACSSKDRASDRVWVLKVQAFMLKRDCFDSTLKAKKRKSRSNTKKRKIWQTIFSFNKSGFCLKPFFLDACEKGEKIQKPWLRRLQTFQRLYNKQKKNGFQLYWPTKVDPKASPRKSLNRENFLKTFKDGVQSHQFHACIRDEGLMQRANNPFQFGTSLVQIQSDANKDIFFCFFSFLAFTKCLFSFKPSHQGLKKVWKDWI